ncbi:hypothetical protein NMY22_g4482 [Coprinellus aureogranulatus]|nr:hypothetical protein NMY22_g4482 [Coprinellus aureogranulatus]
MTELEIVHAATSPYRLVRLVKDWYEEQIYPFQSREHPQRMGHFSQDMVEHVVYEVTNFYLVPGGRFLVASDEDELILWDLGYNSKQFIRPFPLTVGERAGQPLAVAPTADGKELLVATLPRIYGDEFALTMYRVNPVAPAPGPQFQRIAELPPVGGDLIKVLRLANDMAVIWDFPNFIIWNWVEDTACKWKTPLTGDDIWGARFMVYANKHSAIACTTGGVLYIWDIPTDLHPLVQPDQDILVVINAPKEVVTLSTATERFAVRAMVCSTQWQQRLDGGDYLALLIEENGRQQLRAFLVERIEGAQQVRRSQAIKEEFRCALDTKYADAISSNISPLHRVGDDFVFSAASTGKAMISTVLSRRSRYSDGRFKVFSAQMTLTDSVLLPNEGRLQPLEVRSGFCPAAGRLVYLRDSKQSPAGELLVADYLLPPLPSDFVRNGPHITEG